MQQITIIGRLGVDASVKENQRGMRFLTFSVAVDGRNKGESYTAWYRVIAWDTARYEKILQYLKKGSPIIVTGELFTDVEIRDGRASCVRIVTVDSIKFVPSNGRGNSNESGNNGGTRTIATASSAANYSNRSQKSAEAVPDDIPMTGAAAPKPDAAVSSGFDDDLPF